jgi:hypothetical protein
MTRLYLTADEIAVFDPGVRKGAWDKTSGVQVERLGATRFGRGAALTDFENNVANNYDVLLGCFVSDPILANTTISGTLDAIMLCAESSASANDVLHLHVWVTQGDSSTVRGTLLTDYIDTTEFAVNAGVTAFSGIVIPQQTVSSVSAQAGDRIVVEAGYQAQNTVTTAFTGGIVCGGRSADDATGSESAISFATNPVPWVEFSTTIAFTPTYLFMRDVAASVTPGASRGTWDIDSPVDWLFGQDVGTLSTWQTSVVTETSATNPTDALGVRLVSDQLAAQTIAVGTINCFINQIELQADSDAFPKWHLYVMAPDGSVRGTLLSNFIGGTELRQILQTGIAYSTTISSVATSLGDRIVLEAGARFTNTLTASRTLTNYVGSGAASGKGASNSQHDAQGANCGWIRFPQHILFQDAPVGFPYSQVIWVGGGA